MIPGAGSLALVTHDEERSRWKVRGDRVIDEINGAATIIGIQQVLLMLPAQRVR